MVEAGSSMLTRLVTSITIFPSRASPSSPRISSRAVVGTARMTASPTSTASRLLATTLAPVSRATDSALCGVAAVMVTA